MNTEEIELIRDIAMGVLFVIVIIAYFYFETKE